MISLNHAENLLDFSTRLGKGQRAQEQLEGAVALHNILQQHKVAYLADEVGMGKTYVALGVVALFRHFQPHFRVAIISPRENIQRKWMKELKNFILYNVKYDDLRVRGIGGRPLRQLVACHSLLDFVREATLDQDRDFFLRMTSFSLPLSGRENVDPESVKKLRNGLRRYIPWLSDDVFDLRRKQEMKDNFARAINCALPVFDLVIVDEGHNLKHGLSQHVASRNRVLALAFGHGEGRGEQPALYPGYGPRARRVLFLSATPVEETYEHLWNQLHVFGMGSPFADLKKPLDEVDEERKKLTARQFLIRRVTSIRSNGKDLTKNQYRREWRQGGVSSHDDPIQVRDDRERLVVALVQKKVAELLGSERFNASFQMGMLASFESFLETAKVKKVEEEAGTFDDADQTEDQLERDGIDIHAVNALARDYHRRFNAEMPHPKMDAVVESLQENWKKGEKALIFVRRVASVTELKRKLDNAYNDWLIGKLRKELPAAVLPRFEQEVSRFVRERTEQYDKLDRSVAAAIETNGLNAIDDEVQSTAPPDEGGLDTFFAWYFRGEGPKGVVSGANVQRRFIQRGTVYATFFEDNYVAFLLECEPGEVGGRLAKALKVDERRLRAELQERSRSFLGQTKKIARGDHFEAVQAAAVEWLARVPGPFQDHAQIIWHERFEQLKRPNHSLEALALGDVHEQQTFFTELRKRAKLRKHLWPEVVGKDFRAIFRERELRAQLLGTAARLGHAFIDLYIMTIKRLGSLDLRTQEEKEDRSSAMNDRIQQYLAILEDQLLHKREWSAFNELAAIAENYALIMDVNAPDAKDTSLLETKRLFGQLLRQQQPVGGMFGGVNQTLVRQFRMPGYPLIMITTDVLQEGEDLHTFCSSVHHYGISWTPSSMEQRIGRIDRVRSLTDRRLAAMQESLSGEDKLQVYFPHLQDTVEVLQVETILERMNVFLRLMHEGLTTAGTEEKRIDAKKAFIQGRRQIQPIKETLKTAFGIQKECVNCRSKKTPAHYTEVQAIVERFTRLKNPSIKMKGVKINWETQAPTGMLLGTVTLGKRVQPFTLILESLNARPLVRCISPVGRVMPGYDQDIIQRHVAERPIRIGAILQEEGDVSYDLTVEGDVLFGDNPVHDSTRMGLLVRRVTTDADRLERALLPGKDEPLPTFRKELEEEVGRER